MRWRAAIAPALLAVGISSAAAGEPREGTTLGGRAASFAVAPDAVLETGDTFVQGGVRLRLYGVQACLRGTAFTNPAGRRLDCGEASLAMLGALMKDLRPHCVPVAQGAGSTTFVVCYARLGGRTVELGTVLVATGFAFAAMQASGVPVQETYRAAEDFARVAGKGLWAAADLPHPNAVILRGEGARSLPPGSGR